MGRRTVIASYQLQTGVTTYITTAFALRPNYNNSEQFTHNILSYTCADFVGITNSIKRSLAIITWQSTCIQVDTFSSINDYVTTALKS